MMDHFERLKDALERNPPPPDPEARQAALATAMARFQKQNATGPQGIAARARPISSDGTGPSAIWSKIMDALKPSRSSWTSMLAGTASLAVLILAVVSTGLIRPDLFERQEVISPPMGKPASVEADEAADTASRPEKRTAQDFVARDAAQPVSPKVEAFKESTQRSLPSPTAQPAPPALGFSRGAEQFAPRARASQGFAPSAPDAEAPAQVYRDQGRDRFETFDPNPVKVVAEDPVSTFSIDVDTASYAFMRARLNEGVLPPADSVRVEELINYFPYDYAGPDSADTPFKANVSVMPTPWNAKTKLMLIGIKGYVPAATETPRANLVFLIDTSGSMQAPDKLPLLRNAFGLLLTSLHPDDTVAIVTYAGSAGTALEPTKVSDKTKILAALDSLSAGGSTAGAEGIRQAYALAEANKVDGINRVILATDGDFNVGISDNETLKDFVARKRATGVSLSVLGFGAGNYNDALMQALAQNGNGNAAYIDTLTEARKVLVDDVAATLQTIAKDVKIQVEFNPAAVAEYRLIGYETRVLNREDFNNDKVDAGEIGAGHTVTALYEITPAGSKGRLVDDLRYRSADQVEDKPTNEIAFVKIRYKQPDGSKSTLITTPVTRADEVATVAGADTEARFAAAVAGFGQALKGGRYTGDWSIDDAIALAEGARGPDRFGYRNEFVNLARLAKSSAAMAPLKQ
ncbi:MAG TPA: VWA domain-containing protein [Methyloceanibacter sp.]|nr:VWA domain-containing protein [Methyloceanibacter sp.]